MTTAPTNCLTCSEWLRTDDPCVGLCQFYKGWRFQLEGERCRDYAPVGAKEPVEEWL